MYKLEDILLSMVMVLIAGGFLVLSIVQCIIFDGALPYINVVLSLIMVVAMFLQIIIVTKS